MDEIIHKTSELCLKIIIKQQQQTIFIPKRFRDKGFGEKYISQNIYS